MFKKITLLALVVLSTSATFVACSSSDDNTEQNQNSSYNINPPNWLHGTWKNSNGDAFSFTSDDIIEGETSEDMVITWKWIHDLWRQLANYNQSKFYDVSKTNSYYEAEIIDYDGVLDTNIKVNKTSSNSITVKYTEYVEDEVFIENYSLTKNN